MTQSLLLRICANAPMPKEVPPKTGNRWEGTHTYSRTDPGGKRPRTAAQVREEALRRIQEDRKKRNESADRRRSLPVTKAKAAPHSHTQEAEDPPRNSEDPSEEMPGSNKKKRHASSKPGEANDGACGGNDPPDANGVDPGLKAFLLSIKEDINCSTNQAVNRIEKRIDEHAKSIVELKQAVVDVDRKIDGKVETKVKEELAKIALPSATNQVGLVSNRKQQAYNFCRRSLKIWPIEGDNKLDEVRQFLSCKLKFDEATILSLGEIEVGLSPGRAAKERKEILATFVSREERDFVKAAGLQLAGQTNCGMAIHVPGHLMDNLIALNAVGYDIKTKHEGVKRAVKFDDINEDIFMDICIGGNWKRITPTKAKKVARQTPAATRSVMSIEDLTDLVQDKNPPVVVLDEMDE